jgi:hypothetical protein
MSDPTALVVTLTVEQLQDIIRQTVQAQPPRYYSQHDSPLGKRRHLELCKAGALTGYHEGRKVLVKSEDVHAYIERQRTPGPRVVTRPPRGPRKAQEAAPVALPPKAQRRIAELTSV